jgi:hypothetical protein
MVVVSHRSSADTRPGDPKELHVAAYPQLMPSRAVALPDEAPDVTTTEVHVRVLLRLFNALSYALSGQAVVLADIFLRVDDREQIAPDLLIATGRAPGNRTVYRVPPEPVPDVTFEVLSPKNRQVRGRRLLEAKRALLGRIGVPLHVEIDPDDGIITVWGARDGVLVRLDVGTNFSHAALGGVRVEAPAPGVVRVLLPDGREILDGGDELARADQATALASRLADKLRELGFDPDAL